MANASYIETNTSTRTTAFGSSPPIEQTLVQTLVLRSDGAAKNLNVALERLALANRPASEFDNFYTPKNEEFYSKAPYFKLDETRHEIRLLKVYQEKKPYKQHIIDHPEWKEQSVPSDSKTRSIEPRKQKPIIACELVDTTPLSRVDGTYHALSYCAGSPNNVSSILINGIFFNAFANLEHAIECTLDFWTPKNPGKDLLLWVDQICINQDDQVERSSQVRMMQDIYRRSQAAIICISTPQPTSFHRYNAPIPDPPEEAKWLQYGVHPRGQSPSVLSPFRDIDLFVREKIQSNNAEALADLPMCFDSLCTFLSSPWWSRAWVYQEFIMAPRAYFVFKTDTVEIVSWAELSLMFEGVFSLKGKTLDDLALNISEWIKVRKEEEQKENDLGENEKARQTNEWNKKNRDSTLKEIDQLTSRKSSVRPMLNEARKRKDKLFHLGTSRQKLDEDFQKYRTEVQLIDSKIASLRKYLVPTIVNPRQQQLDDLRSTLESLSIAQDSIEKVQQLLPKLRSCMEPVISLMNGKSTRRRVFGLKEVLDHSRRCQASDPRDKIYAFIGLADKGYGIVPNYSSENTIIHLLLHTAQRIIKFESSLDILEHVRHGREKLGHLLPSWVPDWTSNDLQLFAHEFQERVAQIRNQDGNNEPFQASKYEAAEPEFVKDQSDECILDMKVNAIFVESLEDMEGSPYDESALQTFLTPSGLRVHTSQVAACGDEVWIIYGARSPMILRSEQGGRYSFISQAMICESNGKISDVMFGSRMVELEANVKSITIL
ncbi:hypothetical protein N431DRAFT_557268 [Stipitochalara longipes BDJ]|nr:hypothetical protein N431DRAFT_557268 [Stipitochalara longipes BDJ]